MTKIIYLVHDLSDPAVSRRVRMLHAGGAKVLLAGFCRDDVPPRIDGARDVIHLGRTQDGNFPQRSMKVAAALLSSKRHRLAAFQPDIVFARNLEMLVLGARMAVSVQPSPRLVYEILDVHRLLLGDRFLNRALRATERFLAGRASLIVTSSPGFIRHYLRPVQGFDNYWIAENKVLDLMEGFVDTFPRQKKERPGRPLRIGWFGALRCARSLAVLSALAKEGGGAFEVILRGRPAYREFDNFDACVKSVPHLAFEGSYSAADLPLIYGEVDFAWAIDFFEDGLNSSWLLPNRIYESCAYGAVPIARAGTETARFLQEKNIGIVIEDVRPDVVSRTLRGADIEALREKVLSQPPDTFRVGEAGCRSLVAALSGNIENHTHLH